MQIHKVVSQKAAISLPKPAHGICVAAMITSQVFFMTDFPSWEYRVPEDISLVGYDNYLYESFPGKEAYNFIMLI